MITREQAEQAVLQENTANNEHFARECRILYSIEIDTRIETIDVDETYLGVVEVERVGWKVAYEVRDRLPSGQWPHLWSQHAQYVVEAKPGPYVVR